MDMLAAIVWRHRGTVAVRWRRPEGRL